MVDENQNTDSVNVGKEHSGGEALLSLDSQEQGLAYQRRLYDECVTAGWDREQRNTFAEEIAHLHEELSEAFREWRRYKNFETRYTENGKPEGIPIELADVLIGLFYNAELHGFDLFAALEEKHRYNLTRNYTEEGRQLHSDEIRCPGCAIVITPDNAGGYRTFCDKCVDAMPPLPIEGAWNIEGTWPHFRWVELRNASALRGAFPDR